MELNAEIEQYLVHLAEEKEADYMAKVVFSSDCSQLYSDSTLTIGRAIGGALAGA